MRVDPNDPVERSKATALGPFEPSLTQQHFAEECDINVILARVAKGAQVSHLNPRMPMYGDFTGIPVGREAFDFVRRAGDAFMSLDWQTRERFGNDPRKLLDFLENPGNRDEAVKLGLVTAPVPKADVAVEPTPPIKPPDVSTGA